MLVKSNYGPTGAVMNKKHFKMGLLDIHPSHFSIFTHAFKEVTSYE